MTDALTGLAKMTYTEAVAWKAIVTESGSVPAWMIGQTMMEIAEKTGEADAKVLLTAACNNLRESLFLSRSMTGWA